MGVQPNHLNCGNDWIILGTTVKSFPETSRDRNDDKLVPNSCGMNGNELRDKCSALKLGNSSSGTDVSDTLFNINVNKQSSKPQKALSMTFNSLLFDKSKYSKCGNVVNAASSSRNKRLLDKSSVANDFVIKFKLELTLNPNWSKSHVKLIWKLFYTVNTVCVCFVN